MADLTLRLAWYRLAESCGELAVWYEDFSWRRVDVLDMLFLGWLAAAFLVIGAIHAVIRLRRAGVGWRPGTVLAVTAGGSGETVRWLNLVMIWLRERQRTDWLVDECLKSLTDEAKKHTHGDGQVRFSKPETGNEAMSVELTSVATDVTDPNFLTVLAEIVISNASLSVGMVTSSVTSLRMASCNVVVSQLHGILKIQCRSGDETISVRFLSAPNLHLAIAPSNHDSISQSTMESVVRGAICGCKLDLPLPPFCSFLATAQTSTSPASASLREAGEVIEPMQQSTVVGSLSAAPPSTQTNQLGHHGLMTAASRTMQDRKLLVKMVKANGLVSKDFAAAGGCDPYCTVSVDDPPQQQSTSVVKNTVNPFFDEHFLFTISNNTHQLKFEVFDRRKSKTGFVSEFLGEAVVTMDEVRRIPSNRQIIPLMSGRTATGTMTSGSVTVELLLMDTVSESLSSHAGESVTTTPYRCIETSHTLMPGGTLVTTTTTTTDRLKDVHTQPRYNESPVRVEKSVGPHVNHEGHDVVRVADRMTDVVMQELSGQQRTLHGRTTTVTVLGKPKEQAIPVIKTGEAVRDPNFAHQQNSTETKKKSLSGVLRRKFGRGKDSNRAQSVERIPAHYDSNLLQPPHAQDTAASTSRIADGDLSRIKHKSRSQSLSASFRNLFRRGKRSGGGGDVSRDSSVSRSDVIGMPTLHGESTATPSPQLSTSSWTRDSQRYTPDYTPRSYQMYAAGGVGSGAPVLAARPSPLSHPLSRH